MALTIQTATAAAATVGAPKQIQVAQSSSSAVMYSVPSGREFTGILGSASYQYFPTINDVDIKLHWISYCFYISSSNDACSRYGCKGSATTSTFIFGVERDAT